MKSKHYIVFVGASQSLYTELIRIEKEWPTVKIIAPIMKKKKFGINAVSSKFAIKKLYEEIVASKNLTNFTGLSVWFYEPNDPNQMKHIWEAFGHSAWVQMIPKSYLHKPMPTREFIKKEVTQVLPLLHVISGEIYGKRNTSPLTLPLRNFKSQLTHKLKSHWYDKLNEVELKKKIDSYKGEYVNLKNTPKQGSKQSYLDDKLLFFAPAKALHGKAHPSGTTPKSFTCGRFRYGAALYPGFHYDVSAKKTKTIQCMIYDSLGKKRSVGSENREHINIFPNDYLLPKK